MQAANIMWAAIQPHSKNRIDPNDYLLFPDDAHSLPDDVASEEKAWMLRLQRSDDQPGGD